MLCLAWKLKGITHLQVKGLWELRPLPCSGFKMQPLHTPPSQVRALVPCNVSSCVCSSWLNLVSRKAHNNSPIVVSADILK